MSIRPFLRFAAAMVLGAAFATSAAAQNVQSIKLGVVTWIGYGPLYIAESLDLWKKHGLKVQLQNFTDPALLPGAIMAGALDGGLLTYDQLVGQVAKGDTMRAVMPLDFSNGGDAIVATTDITGIPALKGQKVAFAPLSPSDFLLSFALRKHGLKDGDVKPVGAGPEAVPAAMASGQVKIGVTYEPMISQITAMDGGKRFHVIYSSKQSPGLLSDVLVFTDKAMKTRGRMINGVMAGYLEALEMIRTRPDESAKIIGKALGISEQEVLEQQQAIYAL
ncbi:MAG: ABC transporter substrate-binding protein, partial [Burkholderiales bacterium]|nr:ABC transporter substrate-binding protein [Burkholderiales bacterium]